MAEAGADYDWALGSCFQILRLEVGLVWSRRIAPERWNKGATTDRIFEMVETAGEKCNGSLWYLWPMPMVFSSMVLRLLYVRVSGAGSALMVWSRWMCPLWGKEEFWPLCKANMVWIWFSMVAPPPAADPENSKEAKGFIYVVSSLGVTGMRNELPRDLGTVILADPCCDGYALCDGIWNFNTRAGRQVDGAWEMELHRRSAIVKLIWRNMEEEARPYIQEYVRIHEGKVVELAGWVSRGRQNRRQEKIEGGSKMNQTILNELAEYAAGA